MPRAGASTKRCGSSNAGNAGAGQGRNDRSSGGRPVNSPGIPERVSAASRVGAGPGVSRAISFSISCEVLGDALFKMIIALLGHGVELADRIDLQKDKGVVGRDNGIH